MNFVRHNTIKTLARQHMSQLRNRIHELWPTPKASQ